MPKQQQTVPVNGADKESILSICFGSFKKLDWDLQFAGEDVLIGTSPKSWKTKSQQIVVKAGDGQLTVSSEMVSGELVDIAGRNHKNISSFLNVFELVRNSIQPAETEENKKAIEELRTETIKTAAREQEEAAEVDKAMNLSGSNLYVTYTIIGLNILVFVLMAMNGAGILEPNGLVHLKWGSNYGPLTLSGDWLQIFLFILALFIWL
jgi:rhomboid protease GluP